MSKEAQHPRSEMPRRLPLVWATDAVLFPNCTLFVSGVSGLTARELAAAQEARLQVLVAMRSSASLASPSAHTARQKTPPIATVAEVMGVSRLADGQLGLSLRGVERVAVIGTVARGARITAMVRTHEDQPYRRTTRLMAAMRHLKAAALRLAPQWGVAGEELRMRLLGADDPARVVELAQAILPVRAAEKLAWLHERDVTKRVAAVLRAASREVEQQRIADDIRSEAEGELQLAQRESMLREQLRALRRELGEEEETAELEDLGSKLAELPLPEEAAVAVRREFERMRLMAPGSTEYGVSHSYLSWLVDLPWQEPAPAKLPSQAATKALLDGRHHGLSEAKERVLEYLAVLRHRGTTRGEVLLFVGPPGVGKTSMARAIAAALGRPFARIALGGERDEAEIRGHRRTYVGAMPGKILQAMRQAGSRAPVLLLDELDKLGLEHGRSTLAHALLEVLDPEQNDRFVDRYLGVPFDLSQVVFVATANELEAIPETLRDRMEVVALTSYDEREKLAIAVEHVVPRLRSEFRLTRAQFHPSERTVLALLRHYAREAGVRQLSRDLEALARKVVRAVVAGKKPPRLTPESLAQLLGPPRVPPESHEAILPAGVAVGLAYTAHGGDVLYIEAKCLSPGSAATGRRGGLKLTGRLGKVMRESAEAAWSYLLAAASEPGSEIAVLPSLILDEARLHLHVPDGATPKDGPSAGLAILAALTSVVTGIALPRGLAMTGEITLRGQVLPVGGIKEKVLAAHRSGKTRVLVPAGNRADLVGIPKQVSGSLELVLVRSMEEALREAGLIHPTPLRRLRVAQARDESRGAGAHHRASP